MSTPALFPNSCKTTGVLKNPRYFEISIAATLMIFGHKREDKSREVNMNAFNFSPTPRNFCPVMRQAIRKPGFSASIPRGQHSRSWAGTGLRLAQKRQPCHFCHVTPGSDLTHTLDTDIVFPDLHHIVFHLSKTTCSGCFWYIMLGPSSLHVTSS